VRLILDSGALIAVNRGDRRVAGLIELGRRAGAGVETAAPAVAQVWRDGARQARLARLLSLIDVRVIGLPQARAAGELLAASATGDAVDALVVSIAGPGDQLLTSDPDDLAGLASRLSFPVSVVRV
jgi:hypothetical protein